MQLQLAEVFEQVVDHSRLVHEICLAQQRLPAEAFRSRPAYVGEKVAGVQYALYGVLVSFVYRQAGISALEHHGHYLVEAHIHVEVGDIHSRGHYLRRRGVAEFQNAFEHFSVIAAAFGYFEGARQLGGAYVVGLLGHDSVHEGAGFHKHLCHRACGAVGEHDPRHGKLGPCQRVVIGIQLGQNLAEEKNQECKYNRLQYKAEHRAHTRKDRAESEVAQHYDSYVYEIVRYQNGGQKALRVG